MTAPERRVVEIPGTPGKRTYLLGVVVADRLGLHAHPEHPERLVLRDNADPDVVALFPDGTELTARVFPFLASQVLDEFGRGWMIDMQDQGYMPSGDAA